MLTFISRDGRSVVVGQWKGDIAWWHVVLQGWRIRLLLKKRWTMRF